MELIFIKHLTLSLALNTRCTERGVGVGQKINDKSIHIHTHTHKTVRMRRMPTFCIIMDILREIGFMLLLCLPFLSSYLCTLNICFLDQNMHVWHSKSVNKHIDGWWFNICSALVAASTALMWLVVKSNSDGRSPQTMHGLFFAW